jgi:hypothetical protein
MSSYSTLLIPIINEILVKEIGDASLPPLKWTKVSPYRYKFLIDIGDFTEVATVTFEQITDNVDKQFYFPPKYRNLNNVFNIGYDISGSETQYTKTDLKTLLKIMSTIVSIIKDFIQDKLFLDGLFIQSSEKNLGSGDNSQKNNLYKAYLKQQLNTIPGYNMDSYRNGLIIIKTNA